MNIKEKLKINIREKAMRLKTKAAELKKYNKVIGAAAGIILLGWVILVFIFSQQDSGVKEAASEIEQLAANIRRYYQNRPDYWGLNTQMVLDKNISPNRMRIHNVLTGYFENSVLVGNGINGEMLMPGSRNFDIVYKGLNKNQCIGLASFRFDQKFWLGVTGVSIVNNKGQQQLFSWNDEINQLPVQKAQAKALCGKENTIIWHCE